MQPRKVIIVIENIAGKGGTERVASGLANALARLPGYEVALFRCLASGASFRWRTTSGCAAATAIRCSGHGGWRWPCGVNART